MPTRDGDELLGCGQSYECLDKVRMTNLILSTGDKVTCWPNITNDQYPTSLADALCGQAEDHVGPTLNIRGKGKQGPKSRTNFLTYRNLGWPSPWNGNGHGASVVVNRCFANNVTRDQSC
jgi:hypothetical protein